MERYLFYDESYLATIVVTSRIEPYIYPNKIRDGYDPPLLIVYFKRIFLYITVNRGRTPLVLLALLLFALPLLLTLAKFVELTTARSHQLN